MYIEINGTEKLAETEQNLFTFSNLSEGKCSSLAIVVRSLKGLPIHERCCLSVCLSNV